MKGSSFKSGRPITIRKNILAWEAYFQDENVNGAIDILTFLNTIVSIIYSQKPRLLINGTFKALSTFLASHIYYV